MFPVQLKYQMLKICLTKEISFLACLKGQVAKSGVRKGRITVTASKKKYKQQH